MAARTSNSVLRAAAVLQVLAAEPSSSWSLAEIARRADLSYASAHSVASALEESGLVRRHPHTRAYTLGPALIALGAAAQRGYRVVDDALPEMERLSHDLGLGCLASSRVGDDMVMLAVTGPPQPFGSRVQVGERVPIAPPLGLAFIAWADAATIEDYLDSSGRTLTTAERRQYSEALALVRERGYGVVLDSSTRHRLVERLRASTDLDESRRHQELDEVIVELALDDYALVHGDADAEYAVTALTAPVFGPDGDIILVLTLVGFTGPVRADALPRYAARMFEATSAIEGTMTARRGQP
ncbi:MAG TPA: helix-turn-helix domain-containing protein [Acidimicrobiia bacterium]|nr:helix-turn-helix domain-containing protein [Acidimicrobiia bacterium]